MGRRGLLVAALLGPLALALAWPRLRGLARPDPSTAMAASRPQPRGATAARPPAVATTRGVDPNLPLVVGDSRRLIARAIDDTAAAPHEEALVALARRFQGTPFRAVPAGAAPAERLVLDLTAVDSLRFIEQLLALVNSRQVRTRTEAVDRFSDHVRRLRYGRGRVDPCARLDDPRLWALAAARRGYLVDLSPFLPGARRRRVPLTELLHPGSTGSTTAATAATPAPTCPEPGVGWVTMAEVPLDAVPAATASLRSGDLFVLQGNVPDGQTVAIGLLDLERGRLGAVLVRPGQGVVRVPDLLAMARQQPGRTGLSFLRSLPNADGRADP